jgi:hypothetical protein
LCDQAQCYRLYTATKNFDGARKQCALDGGDLVTYSSLGQQLLVENYFKAFTLPAGYWTGVSRATTTGAQWQYVDGSPVSQKASNDPYAHFTWIQASQVCAHPEWLWRVHIPYIYADAQRMQAQRAVALTFPVALMLC